jgi:uncharacterized membrane protein
MARDFTRINLLMAGFVIAAAIVIGFKNKSGDKYHNPSHIVLALVLLAVVCIFSFISNGTDGENYDSDNDNATQCAKKGVWVPSIILIITLLIIAGPPILKKIKELKNP